MYPQVLWPGGGEIKRLIAIAIEWFGPIHAI